MGNGKLYMAVETLDVLMQYLHEMAAFWRDTILLWMSKPVCDDLATHEIHPDLMLQTTILASSDIFHDKSVFTCREIVNTSVGFRRGV